MNRERRRRTKPKCANRSWAGLQGGRHEVLRVSYGGVESFICYCVGIRSRGHMIILHAAGEVMRRNKPRHDVLQCSQMLASLFIYYHQESNSTS